jgi:tetratricopeptide (TPR) repeat protein
MRALRAIHWTAVIFSAAVATWAFAHGDLHEQIARVSARIEKEPGSAELFLKRGELHRHHLDWAAAEADYAMAQKLRPEWSDVDLARGKLCLAAGRHEAAVRSLDRFLDRRPDHVEALVTRARTFAAARDFPKAVRDFNRAIDGSPRADPDLYLERARAQAAQNERHRIEALAGLEQGLAKLGPLVTLELACLDIEVELKRYDAALARVNRLAARSPRKETWLARRGEILERAGRNDEARGAFAAALDAIEKLPPRHQSTPAMVALEARVRQALDSKGSKSHVLR